MEECRRGRKLSVVKAVVKAFHLSDIVIREADFYRTLLSF